MCNTLAVGKLFCRGVKVEYLGPNSNIQGPEIHSLIRCLFIEASSFHYQVWSTGCSQAVKYRANNLSGVGLEATSHSSIPNVDWPGGRARNRVSDGP